MTKANKKSQQLLVCLSLAYCSALGKVLIMWGVGKGRRK